MKNRTGQIGTVMIFGTACHAFHDGIFLIGWARGLKALPRHRVRENIVGLILNGCRAATLGLALVFASSVPSIANDIQGKLEYVYDGDTIRVRGVKIRLNGLHAPEGGARGGEAATRFMRANYGGQVMRCRLNGDRTYDRWVGTCWGPGGEDIAAALVAAGLGRDCPRYSGGRYRQFENAQSRSLPLPRYC